MMVEELKDYLESLIEDGKGQYHVIIGEYGSVIDEDGLELLDEREELAIF